MQTIQLIPTAEFLPTMKGLVNHMQIVYAVATEEQKLRHIEAVMLFGKGNVIFETEKKQNGLPVFELITTDERLGRFLSLGYESEFYALGIEIQDNKRAFEKVALLELDSQPTTKYFEKGVGYNL